MSEAQVKPLGNRVLVKRSESPKMKSGIILPDTAKEKPKQGEIVAVGPGKIDKEGKLQPMELKVGERVLFTAYAGSEVKPDLLIMSEDDILGVLTN
jgi:chaperonin GroES